MKDLLAPVARALRRLQPAFAGFAASDALTGKTIPLRKFPENRFDVIVGGLAVLIAVVGLTTRAFSRRVAQRRRPARARVEPVLAPEAPVMIAREAPAVPPHVAPAVPPQEPGDWNLALLDALGPRRFQTVCAACFESLGYEVRAGAPGAGRRVDLRLHAEDAAGPCALVRCRAARGAPAPEDEVRELLAALAAEGAAQGILVSSSGFTLGARALAAGQPLHLIDGGDLLWKIGRLEEPRQRALRAQVSGPAPTGAFLAAARADPADADYSSRVMLP